MLAYRSRVADLALARLLQATGAVVIEGPRGCGKTETARRAARSEVLLDVDDEARAAGLLDPDLVLAGARPRLLDEWQLVPAVWNRVRRAVDAAPNQPGQFLLTGSAAPADDVTRHSGALRFSRLRMRPMSLFEVGRSTGEASLTRLLAGEEIAAPDPGLRVAEIAELVAVGGWPGLLHRPLEAAQDALRGYLAEASLVDIGRIDGIRRDPGNIARVLRSLARHVATQASTSAIAADVGGADGPIDRHTVADYVRALTRLMIVEDLPAWAPTLRSRAALRGAATRHFVDPSLAVAALGATPERLLRDVRTLGLLFENLVVRDLRVYAQPLGADTFHYRDSDDVEVDVVVATRDGGWAAFEVKLGPGAVDEAAAALLRVRTRVDPERHGEPRALVAITGWGYAYRRPDGVTVVPIGALGP